MSSRGEDKDPKLGTEPAEQGRLIGVPGETEKAKATKQPLPDAIAELREVSLGRLREGKLSRLRNALEIIRSRFDDFDNIVWDLVGLVVVIAYQECVAIGEEKKAREMCIYHRDLLEDKLSQIGPQA